MYTSLMILSTLFILLSVLKTLWFNYYEPAIIEFAQHGN